MIYLTNKAKEELSVIFEKDFTLSSKILRIKISGKHCNGFSYEFLIDEPEEEDQVIFLENFQLCLDPFVSKYFKQGFIDFQENDFHVVNIEEKNYQGKFFLKQ
jgi:Fe-S cluster assembly iron-binding protein IscA